MRRIHINESQLREITESMNYTPEAGTDHPCFYDEDTDTWYEATWDGDFGFPFGFWNNGLNYEFSVGPDFSTHIAACGKVAKNYYINVIEEDELLSNDALDIEDKVNEIVDTIKDGGYEFNYDSNAYVNGDGDEIKLNDEVETLVQETNIITDYDYIYNLFKNAIEDDKHVSGYDIRDYWVNLKVSEYDFLTEDGLRCALDEIGSSFQEFFEKGYGEGRIWPYKEMIGFYPSEQPSPNSLLNILRLLSQNIGVPYIVLMNYHIVFEDNNNNGKVTACTVSDYVDGNYGNNHIDYDKGEEIRYNNGEKTTFVPHLANQAQKREFFKDFRGTRDNTVYAPKERGGNGTLAQYHAMRYPYGENKNRNKKVIR